MLLRILDLAPLIHDFSIRSYVMKAGEVGNLRGSAVPGTLVGLRTVEFGDSDTSITELGCHGFDPCALSLGFGSVVLGQVTDL